MNNIRDNNALRNFFQMAHTGAAVNPANITLLELCNELNQVTPATILLLLDIHPPVIPVGLNPNDFEIDISKCGDIIDWLIIKISLSANPPENPNNARNVFINLYGGPLMDGAPNDHYDTIERYDANIIFFQVVQANADPPVFGDEISLEDFTTEYNDFMNLNQMPVLNNIYISGLIHKHPNYSFDFSVCTELLNMLFIQLYMHINMGANEIRQSFVNQYGIIIPPPVPLLPPVAFPPPVPLLPPPVALPNGLLPIFFGINGTCAGVNQVASNWSCPICINDESTHPVIWLACGHKYHDTCINLLNTSPNIDMHFQCPTCRLYSVINAGNMIGGNPIRPVGAWPGAYHYFTVRPVVNYEGKHKRYRRGSKKGRRGSKKGRRGSKKCKRSKRMDKK
jgi:hypothetical protein